MTMSQWSNEVMETYRKVQRALTRAQQQQRERSPKKDKKKVESVSAQSEPQAEPPIQQDHQLGDQRDPERLLTVLQMLVEPRQKATCLSFKMIQKKNNVNGMVQGTMQSLG